VKVNVKASWSIVRQWLASISVLVEWGLPFGTGIAMAQWDEFGPAIVCFVSASLALALRTFVWKGIDNRPTATNLLKACGVAASVAFFIMCWIVTCTKKGDKTWSPVWDQYFTVPAFGKANLLPIHVPANGYSKTVQTGPRVSVPRSYLVWVGTPIFAGGQHESDPLEVGQVMGFNVYYKQDGPNPVELLDSVKWLYTRPDLSKESQKSAIADFNHRVNAKREREPIAPLTLLHGENPHYFTAIDVDDSDRYRQTTQDDLDNLKIGRKVVYILSLITYKDTSSDSRKEHHLRLCMLLQPPAIPPGVWQFCDAGFNQAD
jgi:hypothetical protein